MLFRSVFSFSAGRCASFDDDLGPGWKHLTGMRRGGVLRLYVGGRLVAESTSFKSSRYDLTVDQSLKIGFGEQDYFTGRIEDVRLYRRALSEGEITALQKR